MKKTMIACIVLCFSFTVVEQTDFNELHSLAGGTWTMKTRRGLICEEWQKKSNTQLSGRSYQVAGTDTSWLETLDLSLSGHTITYTSLVKGQNDGKAVPFVLTEAKAGQFIFSNPAHDFPQRIVYQFITKDSVHAWIDGKINGKERKSDFYYSRSQNSR